MWELFLVATLASHHFNDARHFQEWNPGAGIGMVVDRQWTVEAGGYRNSTNHPTWYAAVGLEHRWAWLGVGGELGLVTGYRWPVMPIAFPYAVLILRRVDVKVDVLPMRSTILGVQVRWRL